MKNDAPNRTITFAEFELDTARRRLSRDGATVNLNAKAFDLLAFLTSRNGRIVSKDEILETVWEGSFVEESNLVVQISNLRKALGETKNEPRFLVTVPGKGYKFTAEINDELMVIETHTVSELTIEQEVIDEPQSLSDRPSRRRWLTLAAVAVLVFLTVGAIGYWRSQRSASQNSLAFAWTNPPNRVVTRQLTANGRISEAALSPDGTLYAYTDEGGELSGLWVAGVSGAQTIEVLAPSSFRFTGLTFAPDGLHIYYVGRETTAKPSALYRVPTFGGLPEKVLDRVCCAVTFSPDGRQFAFRRGDSERKTTAVIIANTQGPPDEKEIAVRPVESGFNDNGASWSPDGTKIAIGAKDETTAENAVFLVDVKTGQAEKFGKKPWNYVRRVEWLPDGSGLLVNVIEKEFWEERQIWLIEYPSGKTYKITNDTNRYGRETVSVSRDGTKILGVGAQTVSNVFVGNANDFSKLQKITQNSVGKNDGLSNSLTWTPDEKLLFARRFDKSISLWMMNADGTNGRQLTTVGNLDVKPEITRDGRFIVFQSTRGGLWNLWRVNSDGSDLKQLTFDHGSAPSLTPDGKWVFYQNNSFIWKVSIDGGKPVQMTGKASKAVEVSPDGQKFACFYRLSPNDKLRLAVFPIEGGEPLQLFDVPVDLAFEKMRWTPDGQAIVYAFYNSTAWKQNLAGGAPEKFLEFPGEIINALTWSPDGQKLAVAYGQEPRDVVLFTLDR